MVSTPKSKYSLLMLRPAATFIVFAVSLPVPLVLYMISERAYDAIAKTRPTEPICQPEK